MCQFSNLYEQKELTVFNIWDINTVDQAKTCFSSCNLMVLENPFKLCQMIGPGIQHCLRLYWQSVEDFGVDQWKQEDSEDGSYHLDEWMKSVLFSECTRYLKDYLGASGQFYRGQGVQVKSVLFTRNRGRIRYRKGYSKSTISMSSVPLMGLKRDTANVHMSYFCSSVREAAKKNNNNYNNGLNPIPLELNGSRNFALGKKVLKNSSVFLWHCH